MRSAQLQHLLFLFCLAIYPLQAQSQESPETNPDLATFELTTGTLSLPVVEFNDGENFWVDLKLLEGGLVKWMDYGPTSDDSLLPALYDQDEGTILVPYATLTKDGNPINNRYQLEFNEYAQQPELLFSVKKAQRQVYEISDLESGQDRDATLLIKNKKSQESLVVFGEKSGGGALDTTDGITYVYPDGNSLTVFLDGNVLPAHASLDDIVYSFYNYSSNTVSVTISDPNSVSHTVNGAKADAAIVAKLLEFESSADSIGFYGLVIKLAGCMISQVVESDGIGKIIAGSACKSSFGALHTLVTEERAQEAAITTKDACDVDASFNCLDSVSTESIRSFIRDEDTVSKVIFLTSPSTPDITISGFSISGAPVSGSTTVTLEVAVRNNGSGTANGIRLGYFLSEDPDISPSDELISSTGITEIQSGALVSRTVTYPGPANPGNYYLGACILNPDPGSQTATCTSGSSYTFAPPETGSDLPGTPGGNDEPVDSGGSEPTDNTDTSGSLHTVSMNSFSVSEISASPTHTFSFSAVLSSTGGEGSHNASLVFFRSTDALISDADLNVGSMEITLNGSGTYNRSIDYLVPDISGIFYFGACLSSSSPEVTVDNACAGSSAVSINVVQNPAPEQDLIAGEIRARSELEPGEAFGFTTAIGSIGYTTTSNHTLRYYQSSDANISGDDIEIFSTTVSYPVVYPTFFAHSYNAPDVEGTYYYYACLDVLSNESNKNNNCSDIKTIIVSAVNSDLTVTAFSVRDYSTDPHVVIFSGTVQNQGNGSVASATVRYFQSSDSNITPGDTEIAIQDVSPLNSGVSKELFAQFTMPTEKVGFYYGACVDVAADEVATSNQCSAGVYIVANDFGLPELDFALSVTNQVDSAEPAELLQLGYELTNLGYANAPGTVIHIYLSTDGDISSGDTELGTIFTGSFASQDSQSGNRSVRVPGSTTPGSYYLGACVESTSLDENKGNDCGAFPVTITEPVPPEPPAPPDITIPLFYISSTTPSSPGITVNITAGVQNVGSPSSSLSLRTTLYYYLSGDDLISNEDTLLGSEQVHPSSTFAPSTYDFSTQLDSPGDYYLGACVDPVQDETNISNQCTTGVLVQVPIN